MVHAAIVSLGRWGWRLVNSVHGKSDQLRFTQAVSRDPPFRARRPDPRRQRNGSAEALGRAELVLRRAGKEPEHRRFDPEDSVRANLEAFAEAIAGTTPYPITRHEMVDLVAAFEVIVEPAAADGQAEDV